MKILSISDVITNSSSEVFCTIHHEDEEVLQEIYEKLSEIISTDGYSEEEPVLENVDYSDDEYIRDYLSISLPYSTEWVYDFYKAGLEAILDKYFEDYTINYE